MNPNFHVSEEVTQAIRENRPVVALESTIISHGMPYPQNVETALHVEQTVRDHGAVPATVAILEGVLTVGINRDQIEYLGKSGTKIIKASRRDLPVLLSKGLSGATTVAATMIAAEMAGVKVFATGGIGGVHRGAETTMDISADLEELSRTDVTVVCAGPKSILDISLTLEYLETKGVPVLGYQTEELPAFYCRKSGFPVDARMDTPLSIARCIQVKVASGLHGGMVIANPIAQEYAMPEDVMDAAIASALRMADQQSIHGKNITPFLLETVKELTHGKSLDANIQLVLSNAALAAHIAAEYCKINAC
ncbi:MAG TPA: pseudouridine-5'-phosphate glycosidase [Candidatus Limiplasma sp.]|nr:pseudouridine-5'-phosphate glycosidase [Candidatus Limiplasma sp.]